MGCWRYIVLSWHPMHWYVYIFNIYELLTINLYIYTYKVIIQPYLVLLVSVSSVWKHKIDNLELRMQVSSQVGECIEWDCAVTWVSPRDLLVFAFFAWFDWTLLSRMLGRCNFGHFFFQILFNHFSPLQNHIGRERIRGGTCSDGTASGGRFAKARSSGTMGRFSWVCFQTWLSRAEALYQHILGFSSPLQ